MFLNSLSKGVFLQTYFYRQDAEHVSRSTEQPFLNLTIIFRICDRAVQMM